MVSLRRRGRAAALAAVLRSLPSRRSLALGLVLLVLGVGAYLAARSTSAFAIRAVTVSGAPPDVARSVRSSLEPLSGTSLISLERAEVARRLEAVPGVQAFTYDRAFPHTLHVTVLAERAAVVLRQGKRSWLVSRRGRVLRTIARHAFAGLPRLWIAPEQHVPEAGVTIRDAHIRAGVLAAVPARTGLPEPVRFIRVSAHELTLVLRSGIQLRLGNASELRLKIALARRLAPFFPDAGYVDLGVPERPVMNPARLST